MLEWGLRLSQASWAGPELGKKNWFIIHILYKGIVGSNHLCVLLDKFEDTST